MSGPLFCRLLTSRSVAFGKGIFLSYVKPELVRYASHSFSHSKSGTKLQPVNKILAVMCCFGVGGGAYAYLTTPPSEVKKSVSSSLLEHTNPYIISHAPQEVISRRVPGPANIGYHLTLFQYQSCPFCCKVRAFLDYFGISYDIVEVNPVMRQQIKFSRYRKVPILIMQNEKGDELYQLNDSSVIISILGTFLLNNHEKLEDVLKFYPPVSYKKADGKEVTEVLNQYFLMYGDKGSTKQPEEIKKEETWRRWVDQEFVHVLSPNIYRSPSEALQSFHHFSEVGDWERNFSTLERLVVLYVGAAAMYLIGKRLKKKHALKEDVRDSLYESSKLWMKSVGKSKFMGGKSPNLADLSMYGLLNSIEGCAAFQDLTKNTNIGSWYYNMKQSIEKHKGFEYLQKSHS